MYLKDMLKVLVFYHLTMSNFVIEAFDKVYSVPEVLNTCWLRLVHLVLKCNPKNSRTEYPYMEHLTCPFVHKHLLVEQAGFFYLLEYLAFYGPTVILKFNNGKTFKMLPLCICATQKPIWVTKSHFDEFNDMLPCTCFHKKKSGPQLLHRLKYENN